MSDENTQSETDDELPHIEVVDDNSTFDPPTSVFKIADRERAMLTKTDRELLLGQKEYDSDQGLRNARHRLREHIRNSLIDAWTVKTNIETDELEQIVERQLKLGNKNNQDAIRLSHGILDLAIQIIYAETVVNVDRNFVEHVEKEVESIIVSLIEREHDKHVTESDVNINITKRENVDDVIDDIIHGNPSVRTVTDYLVKFGSEELQSTLRGRNTVIETSEGVVIGPDHEILDGF